MLENKVIGYAKCIDNVGCNDLAEGNIYPVHFTDKKNPYLFIEKKDGSIVYYPERNFKIAKTKEALEETVLEELSSFNSKDGTYRELEILKEAHNKIVKYIKEKEAK